MVNRLQAPELLRPETLRAVEEYQTDTIKVTKGDLVFPLASPDQSKRNVVHKNKDIAIPSSFLDKECERIDFAGGYWGG